jgi:hypothetical protein
MPFIGLFDDVRDNPKFEASGMTSANGWLWIVFDNRKAIGRVDEHFRFRGEDNKLVGETGEDSQFEVSHASVVLMACLTVQVTLLSSILVEGSICFEAQQTRF